MSTWLVLIAGVFSLGSALRIAYRRWRRQRIVARRVVEKPNSHYSSEGVRNQEARDRWGGINLRKLHPLNQEEVQRLIRIVDEEGIKALSPRDRLFLENMTIRRMG